MTANVSVPNPDNANFWETSQERGGFAQPDANFWGAPAQPVQAFPPQPAYPPPPQPYAAPEYASQPQQQPPAPVHYAAPAAAPSQDFFAAPAASPPVAATPVARVTPTAGYDIEDLAVQHNLPPVKLPRSTCSIPAENLLRLFGCQTYHPEPCLPVGVLGPLLIMGHYLPDNREYWGVPDFLIVRVLIEPDQYSAMRQDLFNRIANKPLPAHNQNAGIPRPPAQAAMKSILDWYLNQYPMPDVEREKVRKLVEERQGKPMATVDDLKFLPRHFPIAFSYLQNPRQNIFNPEEAPGQTMFPDSLLEKHCVFPLHCGKHRIWLLSTVPSTYAFEDEWLSSGHDPIKIINVLADPAAINAAIARSRSRSSRGDGNAQVQVGELSYSDNQNIIEIDPLDMAKLNPANPNISAEDLVKWVIYRALTMRGSDLHIEKFYNTARFRARIDGELSVIHSCSEESLLRYIAIIKNWSNMAQERQTTQDGRFSMRIGKKRIDVRVAAVPHRKEFQKIIMRFLDKQDGIKKLSELNMSPRQSGIIKQVLGRDQGLVLVTGPTGSGKTTTLYAFLNAINDENINIQTIEDPIEYEIEGINQTQTDPFHGLDFPTGLRALLRADPDVILIGESRDMETANAAVNAALTGHLVLTTLHANDSLRAISRLLSMGIEPYLLADALALSQAQRLVRRLCSYCKHPIQVSQQVQDFLYQQGAIDRPCTDPIYQKVGCDECNNTGYSGRIALMEMCLVNGELAGLIADGAPVTKMRQVAVQGGFKSLYQEGLVQVLAGNTTFDEINCLSYTALG